MCQSEPDIFGVLMKKGFTLLELLVVVLIIGILAGIALPKYQMTVMKSRYSTMMATVNAINEAEERYYLVHDKYAATFDGLDIDLSGCNLSDDKKNCYYDWGYCEVRTNSNGDRVHCENTKTLNNAYVTYLKEQNTNYAGRRICWAFTVDKNDKWNKLCKDMGAKYWNGGSCTKNVCIMYQF